MKIVTFNWCYGVGSTGKIINDIEECLPEVDFFHIFEYYGSSKKKNVYRLSNRVYYRICLEWARITGRKYDTGIIATWKAIRLLKRIKPDAVHIHCPNASSIDLFVLLNYLKKNGIKTIITNHAEFFYTGNCPHANECMKYVSGCGDCGNLRKATDSYFIDHTAKSWSKMKKAIAEFNQLTMVAVSKWQLDRMAMSPIVDNIRKVVINNGINTDVFRYNSEIPIDSVGKAIGLTKGDIAKLQRKIILHVTAHFSSNENDPKGGGFFIKLAKSYIENPEYVFIVAGTCAPDEHVPENMLLLGNIQEQRLLSYLYNHAEVLVITSKRETFGMSVAESLCCGTPVVGFKNGGSESVAIPEFCRFVDCYGDVDALRCEMEIVLSAVKNQQYDKASISVKACDLYSREAMAEKYRMLYEGD
ncbi:glycosyltransferase [Butyrivibrio fibrisolvens]|uniref:glycosyltransferase n=1 Tax=Butyrivibrio fibrisolvens TaxID=831 RepID=UPI0004288BFF|nr:glycosyltransferase [Butyrivibrio fibrisolvens]